MIASAFSLGRACLAMILLFTVLLGAAYPLAVTAAAQLAFPFQANGSLIKDASGTLVGSSLLAQGFSRAEYLHPRPSAAGSKGYDATSSSGSNLGPMDAKLADRIASEAKALRGESADPIPPDAVTTSASGLDPDISPENARRQVGRIAAARRASPAAVAKLIEAHVQGRSLGVLGDPRVNVLLVNRALDRAFPMRGS